MGGGSACPHLSAPFFKASADSLKILQGACQSSVFCETAKQGLWIFNSDDVGQLTTLGLAQRVSQELAIHMCSFRGKEQATAIVNR